jgi:hypothetical protein
MENKIKKEKKNAKESPKVFYCKHIQAGVAKYADEMLFINNDALKSMMPSMMGVPVYVDHQEVDIDRIQEQADGYVSDCFYNEKDGWFWAKFVAVSDEGHEAIRKGYSVSNAYMPTRTGEGGEWHSVSYDREILEGEYTHLAIVDNPRYEESCIMDCNQFKQYNESLKNQLEELKNSKESNYSIIGGVKMKLFSKKKEEIKNADDLSIELEDGTEVQLSAIVNAVKKNEEKEEAEAKKKEEKYNEEDEVEVGKEKMTIKELKNKYMNLCKKEEEKKNEEDAEEEKKKEEEKKNEEKEAEEKKEEEKKNSKHFTDMKADIAKGKEEIVNSTYQTIDEKLAAGKKSF